MYPGGRSAEDTRAVLAQPLVDSGTHVAVSTSPDVSLPNTFPSVINSLEASSSHALALTLVLLSKQVLPGALKIRSFVHLLIWTKQRTRRNLSGLTSTSCIQGCG